MSRAPEKKSPATRNFFLPPPFFPEFHLYSMLLFSCGFAYGMSTPSTDVILTNPVSLLTVTEAE